MKRYDNLQEAKEALQALLEKVIFSTNYGEKDDDYTKTCILT